MLPPEDQMMPLIELYFATTGTLFPFIEQHGFLDTYRQMTTTGIPFVRRSWLGLLNIMFAIATSTNTGQDSTITAQARARNSDIFYRRAMVLSDRQIRYAASLEVGRIFHHPTLVAVLNHNSVQMLLLTSMYLQGTEHSIATWNVHGLAVKAAYQLGLHSPDGLRQYSPSEREIRKRVWFACVIIDRCAFSPYCKRLQLTSLASSLSMTMGRPISIPESFIKVDLPLVVQDDTPSGVNSSTRENLESVQFYSASM